MIVLLYPQHLISTNISYLDFIFQIIFFLFTIIYNYTIFSFTTSFSRFIPLSFFCKLHKPYSSSEKLQNISNFIQLGLIYNIFLSQASEKLFLLNYIVLLNCPYSNELNTFILNGHKRTYIWSLRRDIGIYFDYIIKNKKFIYRAIMYINEKNIICIELIEENLILNFNSKKINLFHLFSFFGISIQEIFILSRYGNTKIFKLLLFKSLKFYCDSNKHTLNYIKENTINLIQYSNNNNLKFLDGLVSDLVYIIDQLLDYKLKKHTEFNYYNIFNFKVSSLLIQNVYFYSLIEKIIKFLIPFFTNKNKLFLSNKTLNSKLFTKNQLKSRLFSELLHLNPLLQFTDELNHLSIYLHSKKLNKINSISKITSLVQRDIHPSFTTKLSFLNTVEGQHSGLLSTLTNSTILLNTGEISINNLKNTKTNTYFKPQLSSKDNEFLFVNNINNKKKILNLIHKNIIFTNNELNIISEKNKYNDLCKISLENILSLGELLTPFFNYNEPSRCLMSTHMQTQSIPLIYSQIPLIITENQFFLKNEFNSELHSLTEGIVSFVSNSSIFIKDLFNRTIIYNFSNYKVTNQSNLIIYYPLVWVGERINIGTLLIGNHSENIQGYNIGTNLCVTYGYYSGYDYEDALLLNQKLLYNNILSSLHFYIFEIIYCLNKINTGFEYSTNKVPKQSKKIHRFLDTNGIIKEGSKPLCRDLIATKLFFTNKTLQFSSMEIFIQKLFSTQVREIKDNSLYMSNEKSGRVVKLETFLLEKRNFLKYRIFICSLRLLTVGDKLSGRYGNKGIVAKFINPIDLPFRYNLIPDIITSSLSIPSRMNLGQLYETLLGLFAYKHNVILSINNDKIIKDSNILQKNLKLKTLKNTNIYNSNKINLIDGKSGSKLLESNVIGFSFYLKLIHMVKTKIHVRGIGPYTEIFQQPLKGKGKEGGQRLGEMEIWALEAYGASYTIRDLFSLKSDEINSRYNFQEFQTSLEDRQPITQPESLRILLRELNGLTLNIENLMVLDNNNLSNISEKSNIYF